MIFHAQCGGGINPVAIPSLFAQFGMNRFGVVSPLTGENHIELLQFGNV